MLKFAATLLLLFFATLNIQAQTWEIGGALGVAGYTGDLNPSSFKPSGGSAGLFIKRNFNGYIGAKLSYAYGKIGATDSTSGNQQFRDRNLRFTDGLKELSLLAEFHFMKYIPDAGKNKYTPYIYLGAGITSFSPKATLNGEEYSLRKLRTEGQAREYRKSTVVIPYGAGIKYNFSGKWTVAADVGYRYALTDYLDDVSGNYAQPGQLATPVSVVFADRSGERTGNYIGAPGTQRGDFRAKDIYMFFGLTLSYTFVTEKCYYQD